MRKKLSKVLAVASLTAVLMMTLTGCGKVECDLCGETAKCKSYELLGEKINVCGDCQAELDAIGSMFE